MSKICERICKLRQETDEIECKYGFQGKPVQNSPNRDIVFC